MVALAKACLFTSIKMHQAPGRQSSSKLFYERLYMYKHCAVECH